MNASDELLSITCMTCGSTVPPGGVDAFALLPQVAAYRDILGPELYHIRELQDAEHGGQEHDDTHDPWDWLGFAGKWATRAWRWAALSVAPSNSAPQQDWINYEQALLHVAALCIAAVKSSRRKRGLP